MAEVQPNRNRLHSLWLAIALISTVVLAIAAGLWVLENKPDPQAAERLGSEAKRLAARGQLNEALARLSEAKRADPRIPGPYLASAQLLERSAHDREAFAELQAAH